MKKKGSRKKLSRSSEIKKLDRIFSEYIRRRNADHAGYVRCITCKQMLHWKDCHAGHFVSRGCHLTRFDERNVNEQCCGCNTYKAGEIAEYFIYIEQTYGRKALNELMKLKREWNAGKKWDVAVADIREMQKLYKEKISCLS